MGQYVQHYIFQQSVSTAFSIYVSSLSFNPDFLLDAVRAGCILVQRRRSMSLFLHSSLNIVIPFCLNRGLVTEQLSAYKACRTAQTIYIGVTYGAGCVHTAMGVLVESV